MEDKTGIMIEYDYFYLKLIYFMVQSSYYKSKIICNVTSFKILNDIILFIYIQLSLKNKILTMIQFSSEIKKFRTSHELGIIKELNLKD